MSEENTQNLPDTRSFEERVFARFDALEVKLDTLSEEVAVISKQVSVIEGRTEMSALDMLDLHVEQRQLKKRMDKLDSENAH